MVVGGILGILGGAMRLDETVGAPVKHVVVGEHAADRRDCGEQTNVQRAHLGRAYER